jgi:hypothetical protein
VDSLKTERLQIITKDPKGNFWGLTLILRWGDLSAAILRWKDAVEQRPSWTHSIETVTGKVILRNEPSQVVGPEGPNQIWIPGTAISDAHLSRDGNGQ